MSCEDFEEIVVTKPPLPPNELNNNDSKTMENHDNGMTTNETSRNKTEEMNNINNRLNKKHVNVSFTSLPHEDIDENCEMDLYLRHVRNTPEELTEMQNREFIKRLANDFIHYKIFGKTNSFEDENENIVMKTSSAESKENRVPKSPKLRRTSQVLRKVSLEMERDKPEFFNGVCNGLRMDESNAEETFKLITEEVLNKKSLNWGRVVSLFTFGGKVAEWFWESQQEDKIEEVEEWLAQSISSTEDWIEEQGGWENFNETFEPEDSGRRFAWLKPSLMICAGVSLAAVLTMKTME